MSELPSIISGFLEHVLEALNKQARLLDNAVIRAQRGAARGPNWDRIGLTESALHLQ